MSLESYWTDMGRGIGIRGHMVFGWASAPVVLEALGDCKDVSSTFTAYTLGFRADTVNVSATIIFSNMKTIEAKVPDYLVTLASEVAEREKVSLDQIVSMALSAQLEVWRIRDDIATRAARAKPDDFGKLLDKVPDVPSTSGDELSEGYKPSR